METLLRHAVDWIYGSSALLCHQIPGRTLLFGDTYLPVCSRCTGLYTGAFWGAVLAAKTLGFRGGFRWDRQYGLFLAVCAGYAAADWYIGIRNMYDLNLPRLASGYSFGFAVMTVVWSLLGRRAWSNGAEKPRGISWSFMAAAALILLIQLLLAAWDTSLPAYYFFLGTEIVGVLVLFSAANAVMILFVFSGMQRKTQNGWQYAALLGAGLACFAFEMMLAARLT